MRRGNTTLNKEVLTGSQQEEGREKNQNVQRMGYKRRRVLGTQIMEKENCILRLKISVDTQKNSILKIMIFGLHHRTSDQ